MAIQDLNGKPLKTENKAKEEEAAIKEEMDGGKALQVSRLREGQLLLAFMDTATKRLGAIGYMKQIEAQKKQQGIVGDPPELVAMYQECARLESEVVGLVAEINHRRQDQDEMRASKLGVDLYSDSEFFGRPLEQQPETGKA